MLVISKDIVRFKMFHNVAEDDKDLACDTGQQDWMVIFRFGSLPLLENAAQICVFPFI